jgi:hypothetical protein
MGADGYRDDREAQRARLEALRAELVERRGRLAEIDTDLARREKVGRSALRVDLLKRIVTGVLLLAFMLTIGSKTHHNVYALLFIVPIVALNADLRSKAERLAEQTKREKIAAGVAEDVRKARAEREKCRVSCAETQSEIAETEARLVNERSGAR